MLRFAYIYVQCPIKSKTLENLERQLDYEAAAIEARKVLPYTCQVLTFKPGTTEFPIALGSGILLKFNGSHYFFTNAHVSDSILNGTAFVLGRDREKLTLGDEYYFTSLPKNGSRADVNLDVSVAKLKKEVVELLMKRYSFVEINNVKTNHQNIKGDAYLLAGYPVSQTSIDLKNRLVNSLPFLSRTVYYNGDISKIIMDQRYHIPLSFPIGKFRDSVTAQQQRSPSPRGMSGSGVWHLKKSEAGYKASLVSIISEYFENRAVLISTRIDLFVDLIRIKFDPTIHNEGIQIDHDIQ